VREIKQENKKETRRDYHKVLGHVGPDVHPTAGTVVMLLFPRVDHVRQPNHRTASGRTRTRRFELNLSRR
jgi:hypothetical protein